jgi:hypothetical protein
MIYKKREWDNSPVPSSWTNKIIEWLEETVEWYEEKYYEK